MKSFVICLKKGDEAISELISFCHKNEIQSGWFSGLGAAQSAKLAIYDLDKKEYIRKEVSGILEILSYTGNISLLGDKTIVHSHVTLSDETFAAFGGHVDELTIAATCEIVLHSLDIELIRKFDEGIGLNLLEL